MARIARRDGNLDVVPAIFDACTAVVDAADEAAAVDAYAAAANAASPDEARAKLAEAMAKLPYVGEPFVLAAQLAVQAHDWDAAVDLATAGLARLFQWGCCWDKRVAWEGWIAWARCIAYQAQRREWPTTGAGVESLGAVQQAQRFRELSSGSNAIPTTSAPGP